MNTPVKWIQCVVLGAALTCATQAFAQANSASETTTSAPETRLTGFWLTTPHPDFAMSPGETDTIPLTLSNANMPPQKADLAVSGLPEGWTYTLQADGHDVSAAMVLPNARQSVNLAITPPEDAEQDTYSFDVTATYGSDTATLPISVTLAEAEAGKVELKPDLPALHGSPNSTFTYEIEVTNDSAEDQLFNLDAKVPDGFSVTFKKGYGTDEITGVPVAAGQSETVTLEVEPQSGIEAGRYPIRFAVQSGDLSAATDLSADISGTPDVSLNGPQNRLSGSATAGQGTTFPFTVANTGSKAVDELKLSASAPQGWKVEFNPETVSQLAANSSQDVGVTITPSDKAVAGDYMVTLRANGSGVSESERFRVTVQTSTMWGIVGLVIIAIAVIVLVLAVLRYGRR